MTEFEYNNFTFNPYSDNEEECEHTSLFKGVCNDCGMLIEEYMDMTGDNYMDTVTTSYSDAKPLIDRIADIPEEIRECAKQNMMKFSRQNGKNIRNDAKNAFIQLYLAYYQKGINFDPTELSKKLGLKRKDINSCVNDMAGFGLNEKLYAQTGKIIIVHPVNYIKWLCEANKLERYYEEIRDITFQIIKDHDILLSSKPQIVASAIVKLFMLHKSLCIKKFKSNASTSEASLKKLMKEIMVYFEDYLSGD